MISDNIPSTTCQGFEGRMYESMKAYRSNNNYPKRHTSPDSAKISTAIKINQKI